MAEVKRRERRAERAQDRKAALTAPDSLKEATDGGPLELVEVRRRERRAERARKAALTAPDSSKEVTDGGPLELVERPKIQAAPSGPADKTDASSNPKPVKPDGVSVEKTAATSQDAAPRARRARANSLEKWKKARASYHEQADSSRRRNPFEDRDDNATRDGSRQPRSSCQRDKDRQERATSRVRSRSRSGARSRSRDRDRNRSRRSSKRGRSRGSSRGSTNRRRSRSARARSWLRGDSSPERAQSKTRVSHHAHERSILFYEYPRKELTVEFMTDEIRRGTWRKKDALYFRINVIIGRGKKDYFDKAWFKFSVRSHGDQEVPVSVVKYYPERILGPSTEESREDAKNLDFGLQAGLPQPVVPLNAHLNAGGSGRGNMVVQHRCRLELTPYRGSTGMKAHLWKQRTECVIPSRVQVQFVVLYDKRAGLDIKGKLDFDIKGKLDFVGKDGADGLWKKVSTRSWDREPRDFSEWTEADWKSNGDNRLLEE
ncbi:hypothetical protein CONLIGDRAFT_649143 [Coniochaeta ligniaria NRRL 30616]|uniref:Uncharacterized protein n=1 Tax=Coniochaeta ligniaria NRRL 30616 TaxID=1408157 RepID=A0A1J7J8G1_9PEZI|nr:hypothetical protein CONLIGDRAFT_649143 [Coniochaeta ligniaria NRRL 30616]